jgi:hypothetical protein
MGKQQRLQLSRSRLMLSVQPEGATVPVDPVAPEDPAADQTVSKVPHPVVPVGRDQMISKVHHQAAQVGRDQTGSRVHRQVVRAGRDKITSRAHRRAVRVAAVPVAQAARCV